MGFEESMIEDGFHDEGEYLEHLMDEADRIFERQQYEQSLYREEYEDDGYYVDEEYYDELREQYKQWAEENPLKNRIFIAWVHFDTEWDYKDDNFILDKYEEWRMEKEWQMERLQDYYDDFYPRIIKYFEWGIDNPIEEILRQPHIDYSRTSDTYPYIEAIPERELLLDEVIDYEEWIKNKNNFDSWCSKENEEVKKEFFDMVIEHEFNNDTSIEHVRDCILKQMEIDKEPDFIVKKVMNWFDEDGDQGRELFYRIKCLQYYSWR